MKFFNRRKATAACSTGLGAGGGLKRKIFSGEVIVRKLEE
jgi:hypothetical protein